MNSTYYRFCVGSLFKYTGPIKSTPVMSNGLDTFTWSVGSAAIGAVAGFTLNRAHHVHRPITLFTHCFAFVTQKRSQSSAMVVATPAGRSIRCKPVAMSSVTIWSPGSRIACLMPSRYVRFRSLVCIFSNPSSSARKGCKSQIVDTLGRSHPDWRAANSGPNCCFE